MQFRQKKMKNFSKSPACQQIWHDILFTPVWWLWALKYKPVHTYELVPAEK